MRSTRFVVQLHDATTLHFDLRIQAGDVLRSWAVPKGPSLDPAVRRLAVPVEDHELPAGEFEGVHGGQGRGSGTVIIWDEGTAEITRDEPSHLTFTLHGSKLAGGFALTRTGERRWILVKTRDATARTGSDIVAERPASVRTGRTWEQVAAEAGVCEHAAAEVVESGTSEANHAMRAVFRRVGWTADGTVTEEGHEWVRYQITRRDWQAMRPGNQDYRSPAPPSRHSRLSSP